MASPHQIERPRRAQEASHPEFLVHLRIVLAGRGGELLFWGDDFCLRVGIDELAIELPS